LEINIPPFFGILKWKKRQDRDKIGLAACAVVILVLGFGF
jgi:hypothetical protein